ncbi:MAG TPA: sigma factor-like helix-turn-helix DNA-binding protein [Myxococcales bacterium]|nr:sigma factor-like helix-turn-helix DNA-binding protein [Myxococcales bacterium]
MAQRGSLSQAFLQGSSPAAAAAIRATATGDLEKRLASLVRRGQKAWPDLPVDSDDFVAFLAARTADRWPDGPSHDLPWLEDLYLCHACLAGSPGAIEAFERTHFSNLPSHLSQLSPTSDFVGEVGQTLRAKLFVADRRGEKGVAAYTGRGPLGAWFRVTALNTALKLLREEMKHLRGGGGAPAVPAPADPERALIRARTRAELEETLRSVLAQAPTRERALLKMHFVNGSTLEELAQIFKVHRATVARWIAGARQSVLRETQRRMVERFKLSPSELSSAFRITRSEWTLSLEKTLGSMEK